MINVLLTSSTFIKSVTNVSANMPDKFLLSAIRESQEIDLKGILGEKLLNKIKELVRDNEINNVEVAVYKDLLEQCQYFLCYQAISRLCIIASVKIDAMGLSRTRDEFLDYLSISDVTQLEQYYQEKADFFKLEIQNFCLNNRQALPELTDCVCHKIQSNLWSMATSGLWLGGRRGKILNNQINPFK